MRAFYHVFHVIEKSKKAGFQKMNFLETGLELARLLVAVIPTPVILTFVIFVVVPRQTIPTITV